MCGSGIREQCRKCVWVGDVCGVGVQLANILDKPPGHQRGQSYMSFRVLSEVHLLNGFTNFILTCLL